MSTSSIAAKKKFSVLVADENGFNRNIAADILRNAGLDNLLFAKDGEEMLAMTVEHRPRIVICNSRQPKLSGLEFTRMIRKGYEGLNRALSIIVATNTATTLFLEKARSSGVDEILVRPFTSAALLTRVEAVLIRPRRFIDSIDYVGPCRRRRMVDEYGGPLRRFSDPLLEAGGELWEAESNRELVCMCVTKISELFSGLTPGDRRKLRDIYQAVQETEQLADDVRDSMMAAAARSLSRYITAIGASRELDDEVVSTHVDAMQKLGFLTSEHEVERKALVDGLDAVVNKKLGRGPIAA